MNMRRAYYSRRKASFRVLNYRDDYSCYPFLRLACSSFSGTQEESFSKSVKLSLVKIFAETTLPQNYALTAFSSPYGIVEPPLNCYNSFACFRTIHNGFSKLIRRRTLDKSKLPIRRKLAVAFRRGSKLPNIQHLGCLLSFGASGKRVSTELR